MPSSPWTRSWISRGSRRSMTLSWVLSLTASLIVSSADFLVRSTLSADASRRRETARSPRKRRLQRESSKRRSGSEGGNSRAVAAQSTQRSSEYCNIATWAGAKEGSMPPAARASSQSSPRARRSSGSMLSMSTSYRGFTKKSVISMRRSASPTDVSKRPSRQSFAASHRQELTALASPRRGMRR